MPKRDLGLGSSETEEYARHLLVDVGIPIPCFICHRPILKADQCTWEGPPGHKRPVCHDKRCRKAIHDALKELIRAALTEESA